MARDYFLNSGTVGEKKANSGYSAGRRTERDLDTLVGICKGILADRKVNAAEIASLKIWFERHGDVFKKGLGASIFERIKRIYEDGIVTDEEQEDFRVFLEQAVEGGPAQDKAIDAKTSKFFDDPAPAVIFADNHFCFTGQFLSGSRAWCQKEVTTRYGIISDNVTLQTHYLVVGALASADWVSQAWGRKIQKAADYRKRGASIKIIGEGHWVRYLDETPTDADIADGSAADPINNPAPNK